MFTPDCDTDAVEVIDASGDEEALGEPDIVKVIVAVATAVSVAVFTPDVDADTVDDVEATADSDANVDGDSRLVYVTLTETLGEPEMVNVVVVDAKAVSVIVFTPVDETEAEGDEDATNDSDALDVKVSRLE